MSSYAPLPVDSAAVVPVDAHDPRAAKLPKLKLSWDLTRWLSGLRVEVNDRVARKTQENLTNLEAAIATTPLLLGNVTQGIWRLSVTARVTRAATTSSSFQVTITWIDRGVPQTHTGTLVNGNLLTSRDQFPLIIRTDASSPIAYSVAYASVGATPMRFSLDIVAEELAVDLV